MQFFGKPALAMAVVGLAASWVSAQEIKVSPLIAVGPVNPKVALLANKSVQEDLKLSAEQIGKAKELADKQPNFKDFPKDREERKKKFEEISQATEKAVAGFLKPEQLKRLKQLMVQQKGEWAFYDTDVSASLKLSDAQKDQIQGIRKEAGKAIRNIFQQAQGDRQEIQKKLAEHRKGLMAKIVGSLTEEQKKTWQELVGEPFKGDFGRGGFSPIPGGPIQIQPVPAVPRKKDKTPVLSIS